MSSVTTSTAKNTTSMETATSPSTSRKRGATAAGINSGSTFKAVKRRASKACQCCRARKVRCNVVEHGAPCTNCRLDEVECIITESKRRKKIWGSKLDVNKAQSQGPNSSDQSTQATSFPRNGSMVSGGNVDASMAGIFGAPFGAQAGSVELPGYIKAIPNRRPAEDIEFLRRKGAFDIPDEPLRSRMLKAHFDYVHPYMPLLDKKEFLQALGDSEGKRGKIGLLLFQAVMFTGSAFVDLDTLKAAGFVTRRAARRFFYTKARLLYDFDIENDRLTLVQAILLMTYWYETPDEQKDTWHWMGVAVSLSHTIGLHRSPEQSYMSPRRRKLWKRIWWSCVMRDRLVALGMRRPTRIRDDDFEVPMLTLDDFEIEPDELMQSPLAVDFTIEEKKRYIEEQTQLAVMCIQKAKLCGLISEILAAQYSVLNTNHGSLGSDGSTRTTMLLLPKPFEVNTESIQRCDERLSAWFEELPESARWRLLPEEEYDRSSVIVLHRNLLHMVYCTTISALHRPQVLSTNPSVVKTPHAKELRERSRQKVRKAATQITTLSNELLEHDLVKFLPTTGVTAMLPAIIIHLLDIKSTNLVTREASMEGFGICMLIMQGLRQNYASADFACKFLETAIKKSDISIEENRIIRDKIMKHRRKSEVAARRSSSFSSSKPVFVGHRPASQRVVLTPPPDPTVTPILTQHPSTLSSEYLTSPFQPHATVSFSPAHISPTANAPNAEFVSSAPYVAIPHSSAQSPIPAPEDLLNDESFMLLGKDFDPFFGHWDMDADLTSSGSGMSRLHDGESAVDAAFAADFNLLQHRSSEDHHIRVDGASGLGVLDASTVSLPVPNAITPPTSENGSNANLNPLHATNGPTHSASGSGSWPTQQFAQPDENWLDVGVQAQLNLSMMRRMSADGREILGLKGDSAAEAGVCEMRMEDLFTVREDEDGEVQVSDAEEHPVRRLAEGREESRIREEMQGMGDHAEEGQDMGSSESASLEA